jgi:hypothetical protein
MQIKPTGPLASNESERTIRERGNDLPFPVRVLGIERKHQRKGASGTRGRTLDPVGEFHFRFLSRLLRSPERIRTSHFRQPEILLLSTECSGR